MSVSFLAIALAITEAPRGPAAKEGQFDPCHLRDEVRRKAGPTPTHVIARQAQALERRVLREGVGKRRGAIVVDLVALEVQVCQRCVELEHLGKRLGSHVADLVPTNVKERERIA